MTANKSPHRFDNGFIPTADCAHDRITVTRNSPLISGVRREGILDSHGFPLSAVVAAANSDAEYLQELKFIITLLKAAGDPCAKFVCAPPTDY